MPDNVLVTQLRLLSANAKSAKTMQYLVKKFKEPLDYGECEVDMVRLVSEIVVGGASDTGDAGVAKRARGEVWFLEMNEVYTGGVSSSSGDLVDGGAGISVVYTKRGGKWTYHGPGQRVVYLMLDLKKLFNGKSPDISKFVCVLEDWLIESLAVIGVVGKKICGNVGVWVDVGGIDMKIASIGLKVKRWVTFYGVSINVNCNLENFTMGIVPCGLRGAKVCSLKSLGVDITMEEFDEILEHKLRGAIDGLAWG